MTSDPVNHPKHYKLEGLDIEAIDVIRAALGAEGFEAYCIGNALKYLLRQGKKDPAKQDQAKARTYLNFILDGPAQKPVTISLQPAAMWQKLTAQDRADMATMGNRVEQRVQEMLHRYDSSPCEMEPKEPKQ